MSKTVSFFPQQAARNSVPVLAAMRTALLRHGYQICENSMHSDMAVIWSVLWAGRMRDNRAVYEHYQRQSRAVIVVDVGALWRNTTWRIALGNVNALAFYGHTTDLDSDRARRFPIALRQTSNPRPCIVIAAQHQCSLQLQTIGSQEQWIREQASQLAQHTDRPIVVRPHPRSGLDLGLLGQHLQIQQPKRLPGTYDDFDFDYNVHAVVNYSSSPGVLAAIHGARPLVSTHSLAAPVAVTADSIESSYDVDRERWFLEMCHTEYFLDEVEAGLWIKRLGV